MKTALLIFLLLLMLVGAIVGAAMVWSSAAETTISLHGYVAMGLGVVLSIALGVGLMALTFFSAKRGHDEVDIREE
jgi:heme A synthase